MTRSRRDSAPCDVVDISLASCSDKLFKVALFALTSTPQRKRGMM
jgi:hypothetical protein